MNYGARNTIKGRVKSVKKGNIMSLVWVDVDPCEMASVMTVESVDDLELKEGDEVQLVVKAVSVLVVKE